MYCADIVLGPIARSHAEFLLYRNTGVSLTDESREGLKKTFRECYSTAIMSKMRTNGIFFPWGFKLDTVYSVPICVRINTLMRFLHDAEEEKEREMNRRRGGVYSDDEPEEGPLMAKFARLKKEFLAQQAYHGKVDMHGPSKKTEESEESDEGDRNEDMTKEELDDFANKYCPPTEEGKTILYNEPLN
jgi:hypothetical protein